MLTIRKRGKKGIYQVRGTVRVGHKTVEVNQSSGLNSRPTALKYAKDLELKITNKLLNGNKKTPDEITFDDCLIIHLKSNNLKNGELYKIEKIILPFFSGTLISDLKERWDSFCSFKKNISLSTRKRYYQVINPILKSGAKEYGFKIPELIGIQQKIDNAIFFHMRDDIRENLLKCYPEERRDIFIVYSLQGFREQECLQIDYSDIDIRDSKIFIRESKNGEPRCVPMHKKVWWIFARHYIRDGKPLTGRVFRNKFNKGYTDTRITGQGGSPLYKVHQTALKRFYEKYKFKLESKPGHPMRIHDWRHDWAARMVEAGVDLLTLQKLGGWRDLKSVQRYANFSKKHESDMLNRI